MFIRFVSKKEFIKKADAEAAPENAPYIETEIETDSEEAAKRKKKKKIGFRDRKVDC